MQRRRRRARSQIADDDEMCRNVLVLRAPGRMFRCMPCACAMPLSYLPPNAIQCAHAGQHRPELVLCKVIGRRDGRLSHAHGAE